MTQHNAESILAQNAAQNKTTPAFLEYVESVEGQHRAQFAYELKHGMRDHEVLDADPKTHAKNLYVQACLALRRYDPAQAEVLLIKAIELVDDEPEYHLQLGDVLSKQPDRVAGALSSYMNAMKLAPFDTKVYTCIGTLLMLLNREKEAIDYFELALRFDRKNPIAISRIMHLKGHKLDWSSWPDLNGYLKSFRGSNVIADPFIFLSLIDDGQFQKERSTALVNKTLRNKNTAKLDRAPRYEGDKIRIGYFSNDFYNHATMHLLGGVLENHNREKFEIFMYDFGSKEQDLEYHRARSMADMFRDVRGLRTADLAEVARRDELDIAIDLKGFTQGGRLDIFDNRIAPLQVSFLGYPGTTGLRAMDYMIADEITIPSRLQKHYSEKILYMPDCYQPTDDERPMPKAELSRAQHGLPEDAFVFASFNNPYKVTPAEFDVWMELLKEVDNSVLWFYAGQEDLTENLRKEAEARGVDGSRIITTGRMQTEEHLQRLRHADLFLDCFAVNAHTTATETLWAGVPMVTKLGDQFAARVAGSILTAAGLEDLVAKNVKQYKSIALGLAKDPAALAAVKSRVSEARENSALFDTKAYTRNFEALLEQAFMAHENGKAPRHQHLN